MQYCPTSQHLPVWPPSFPHLPCRSYNQVLADDTGLTLQLLPILLGFFTYKGAVIASQSLELFDDLTAAYRGQPGSSSAQRPGGGPGAAVAGAEDSRSSQASVASVDRAFRSKVLRG